MAKNSKTQYRQDLEARVKPMMQQANMMLLNLEQMAKQEEYEGIEQFAYRQAMQSIKELRGEGFKRFAMPKNIHKLEKMERELEAFMSRPTASKKGIEALYERNAATLNEKFGSKFSWQKMGSFLQAAEFEDMKEKFDSATAMIAMHAIKKHMWGSKKDFIEKLEKHQIKDLDEVDSDVLADFVKSNIKWTHLR